MLPLQMIDVLLQEETLLNVVRSVTRNWRSIIITAILALVLVYFFSIVGFVFFKEDFLIETEPVAVVAGELPPCVHCSVLPHTILTSYDSQLQFFK